MQCWFSSQQRVSKLFHKTWHAESVSPYWNCFLQQNQLRYVGKVQQLYFNNGKNGVRSRPYHWHTNTNIAQGDLVSSRWDQTGSVSVRYCGMSQNPRPSGCGKYWNPFRKCRQHARRCCCCCGNLKNDRTFITFNVEVGRVSGTDCWETFESLTENWNFFSNQLYNLDLLITFPKLHVRSRIICSVFWKGDGCNLENWCTLKVFYFFKRVPITTKLWLIQSSYKMLLHSCNIFFLD